MIVDAAHNVASIEAFMATLDQSFAARPRVLVFATTCDKDVRGMLAALVGRFERIVFTRYQNNPRGLPAAELAELTSQLGRQTCQVASRSARPPAWDAAREGVGAERANRRHRKFYRCAEMRPLVLDAVHRTDRWAEPPFIRAGFKPILGATACLSKQCQTRGKHC